MARVPEHCIHAFLCLFFLLSAASCALNTVRWNACHRVPRCSYETDPLINPKPAIPPAGLGHLEAGNGGAKVTPKRLRRSGVIAALPRAPLGPSPEQLVGLDRAAGCDGAMLAHECTNRGAEILEFPDGIGRGCWRDEIAAFGEPAPSGDGPVEDRGPLSQ